MRTNELTVERPLPVSDDLWSRRVFIIFHVLHVSQGLVGMVVVRGERERCKRVVREREIEVRGAIVILMRNV